ncbi:MAG: hypothetical protein H0X29_05205 [Parachlamydiaceae bacterium]|nr:hypothetical protein [Parachlamydiaceae bacterium]
MKPLIVDSEDFISADMRLTHAAKPYFTRMAKKPLGRLEDRYPKTVFLLFEAALIYVEQNLEHAFPLNLEESVIVDLLKSEDGKHNLEITEIIENEQLRSDIPEIDLESLWLLFRDYVGNLQIPSYATVGLLLERGKPEKAQAQALKLKHLYDITRSLNILIQHCLNHKNIEKAMQLFALLPTTSDRREEVSKIVDFLFSQKQHNKAFTFSKNLEDSVLRNHALHEVSLWMVKQGELEQGLKILNEYVEDSDVKAYTLSLIVAVLTGQGRFDQASKLAFTILEVDYRQDAINAIVKKMVRIRRIDKAEEFMTRLEGGMEKKEALKIIESGLKAKLQDERIKKIQIF